MGCLELRGLHSAKLRRIFTTVELLSKSCTTIEEQPVDSSGGFSVVCEEGDPSILKLVGELDLAGVPKVRARFAETDGNVDVDCSGLGFIDASGLGVLVAAHWECDARGDKLVLVDPSPCVERLLELTGLDGVLHVRAAGLA